MLRTPEPDLIAGHADARLSEDVGEDRPLSTAAFDKRGCHQTPALGRTYPRSQAQSRQPRRAAYPAIVALT